MFNLLKTMYNQGTCTVTECLSKYKFQTHPFFTFITTTFYSTSGYLFMTGVVELAFVSMLFGGIAEIIEKIS